MPSIGIVNERLANGGVQVAEVNRSSCQVRYIAPLTGLTETAYRIAASRSAWPLSGETTPATWISVANTGALQLIPLFDDRT